MKILLSALICSVTFSQMGIAPSFPEGDASLQQKLADKIEITCKDIISGSTSTLHTYKNTLKFKKTSKSLFTKQNIKNLYIFLTHIDSTYLFIEDVDYSLLKFLRYQSKQRIIQHTVIDSVDYIVNEEKMRVIRWENGIPFYIYENNVVFESKIKFYAEYWVCGDKLDYASKYPFSVPERTALRKNYTEEQYESLRYIMTHPIMVFSILPLDDNSYELPFNLEGKAEETFLISAGGDEIEGTGIDLNSDKVYDGFWYMDIKESKTYEVTVRLFINVDGAWTPIWYTYFKEM
jgi:hypothetical protein